MVPAPSTTAVSIQDRYIVCYQAHPVPTFGKLVLASITELVYSMRRYRFLVINVSLRPIFTSEELIHTAHILGGNILFLRSETRCVLGFGGIYMF
jgi:hypothetical protein